MSLKDKINSNPKTLNNLAFFFLSSVILGIVSSYEYDLDLSTRYLIGKVVSTVIFIIWVVFSFIKAKKSEKDIITSTIIFWLGGMLIWIYTVKSDADNLEFILRKTYLDPLDGFESILYGFPALQRMVYLLKFVFPIVIIISSYFIGKWYYKNKSN